MSRWIKNTTGSTKTYGGKDILTGAYREIETVNELDWINDSVLLTDIGSGDAIVAKDDSGTTDITDVSDAINYLKGIQHSLEVDDDNRQVVKTATTYKGWRYLAHVIEIETSKIGGIFCKDWEGNDRNTTTIKFYDVNGDEIISGVQADLDSDCVKTVINFKPSYDYDVIGGNIHQHTTPTENIRLWVHAGATELGTLGTKEFVGGLNMKFMGVNEQIETDGRASARLNKDTIGVPYQTNQMQYTITHPAGHNHELMLVIEYFRG